MKTCSRCKLEQDDSQFQPIKNTTRSKSYCKECGKQMCKEYKAKNKEKIATYNKKYKSEHKEEVKEYNHNYNIENRETIQQRQTAQHRERRKTDSNYKLRLNLSSRIQKLIKSKKNNRSYNEFIGCSLDDIKKWLEHNFYGDMTWENYGTVWHVDHVIPCCTFNLENDDQVKICCNWANVQPLLVDHNLSKSGSLYWIELMNHEIKLRQYSKKNRLECELYIEHLSTLKPKDTLYERNRARMASIIGSVERQ